ncbi:MAG: hypothetical protein CSA31_00895 [Desulfobulbus propionicus]|nr:MAG: hypothetical protein CSA31_00895 [Desulfobulbus propionicus]
MPDHIGKEEDWRILARAVSCHGAGRLEDAVLYYQRFLEANPASDVARYNLGLAYFQGGSYLQAKSAFSMAAGLNPQEADYWFNLGLACKKLHCFGEAVTAYKNALKLQPDDTDILYNLGCCCRDCGELDQAVLVYSHLLEIDPAYAPALNSLAYVYHLQDRFAEALKKYQEFLELEPENEQAQYMCAALKGKEAAAPPAAYVKELFDKYSQGFDKHLTENLGYQAPHILLALLDRFAPKKQYSRVLDLGCGTGLCGSLLRPLTERLTGVDLSPRMLMQAEEKNAMIH